MDEYGWNQEEVTRPAAIKFLFASVYNLVAGFLLDRYAPRPIMGAGALLMVFGLVSFLLMDNLWHFAIIYLLIAFGLSMCGLVPSMLITSRWFTKYRGRAVGILLMASSFGGAVLPKIIQVPLSEGDWRLAMMILAGIGFVGMFLPVLWPVRARPEDKQLTPDGLPPERIGVRIRHPADWHRRRPAPAGTSRACRFSTCCWHRHRHPVVLHHRRDPAPRGLPRARCRLSRGPT